MNAISAVVARSVLTPHSAPSSLPYDYAINPYRGCLFGCSYCYASQFVYEDAGKKARWGSWVEYKENAVDALQRESGKLVGKTLFFSSATDPYQPLERRLGLTRALLEVLLFSFPKRVHIQTRSPFVVRDTEMFLRFGDTLTVGISVPTDSDVVRKAFEPRAPSIARRLEAARHLHEAGVRTTASIAPLLPCTPDRLARKVAACFDRAWVGRMNFGEKRAALLEIYEQRGWQRYLEPDFAEQVTAALERAGVGRL
jgi:DNA repair photolyase